MEPRASLTAYATITALAVAVTAATGQQLAALIVAGCMAAWAMLLDVSYLIRRQHAGLPVAHRLKLDRVVRAQWLCAGVLGVGFSVIDTAAGWSPLATAGRPVDALIVGLLIGICAVWASALVDWYWVLPKVSGQTGTPPCTQVGGKRFAGVTKIWYFHRAAATLIVTFVLAAVPAYIAGVIDSAAGRTLLTLLGTALAIGFNAVNAGTVFALKQFLEPRVYVGDLIRVRPGVDDDAQDAYVVDVAIQGLKYKLADPVEEAAQPEFVIDGVRLAYADVERVSRSDRTEPVCPGLHQCRAVNWYCIRNRNAHDNRELEPRTPAEMPGETPVTASGIVAAVGTD